MTPPKSTHDDVAAIVTAFNRGATLTDLATAYNVHPNTISRLLRRSGAERRGARKRVLDPEQERRVYDAYLAGETVTSIATRFAISPQHVSRVAIRQGAQPRRPGQPGRRPHFDRTACTALAAQYQNGASIRTLAADHAASRSAVHRALERSGIDRRPRHVTTAARTSLGPSATT